MKKFEAKLTGVTPLLMHAGRLDAPHGFEKKPPKEQAEFHAYRDPRSKELFVPAENLMRAFISGAAYSKGKGRSSLQKTVAAALFVSPTKPLLGTKIYEVDSRVVVNPGTGGRIMRHRARVDNWKLAVTIEYDDALLTPEQVKTIVADTGARVGILDFRPERKGPYGRFTVRF